MKWSQILLNDFNEIDRNLVDAEKLFCNLTNLKELEEWSLNDTELTDFQKEYIDFFKHLYELYSNFNNKIISEGIAYQGLIYKIASENIVDFKLVYNDVWFVGLNALTKSEKIIINYLKNKGIAKFFGTLIVIILIIMITRQVTFFVKIKKYLEILNLKIIYQRLKI